MKRYLGFFSLLMALIFFAFIICPALAQSYKKYCNGRFGFCVEYPVNFGMELAPENNDGRAFYDGERFQLSVSGINNIMDETLKSEMISQEQNFDNISYRTGGSNWYVLAVCSKEMKSSISRPLSARDQLITYTSAILPR